MAKPLSLSPADPGSSCPVAPGARVRIYELGQQFEVILNLCKGCLTALGWVGWQVRMNRTPPFDNLACDCCEKHLIDAKVAA